MSFILTCVVLYSLLPNYTVEAYREHQFVINKSITEVQMALGKDDIMQKLLDANNARVLEQRWVDGDIHIQRPFSREHRKWNLSGTFFIKVAIQDPLAGELILDLQQKLDISREYIHVDLCLDKPMNIGVTDMRQVIKFEKHGEDQTIISMKVYLRFCRKVPSFLQDFTYSKVHESADMIIKQFEPLLRDHIANSKPGIRIPLNLISPGY